MAYRFWANKENIFYTIVTIFLLERVRRGCNRIESRGRAENLTAFEIERRQETFTFGAALLYALPFLLPTVKYVYRSVGELSHQVPGLAVLNNIWAFAVILLAAEALLAIVLYNLLGIYVERMNGALGFFKKLGRSVLDGSKVAVHTVGVDTVSMVAGGVRTVRSALTATTRRTRALAAASGGRVLKATGRVRSIGARSARAACSRLASAVTRPGGPGPRNGPESEHGGLR